MIIQKDINGFLMHLNLEDGGISAPLAMHGGREKAFMSILDKTIKKNMVCVDVGANIGYTTLHMLRNVGKSGFVYAVEPDPQSLKLLEDNVDTNDYEEICEIINCAISSTNKKIDFWLASKPNLSSVAKTKYSTKKINIDAFSLETFLQDRKYPNFIKMDVEGHEVKVFEGALDYFTKNNEGETNILVEVHPAFYNEDNDFGSILKKYFDIGFNSKYVVATPVPQPRLFKEAGYEPHATVQTDGFHRGIYDKVSNEDLIRFACQENEDSGSKKIVRSFMITREK